MTPDEHKRRLKKLKNWSFNFAILVTCCTLAVCAVIGAMASLYIWVQPVFWIVAAIGGVFGGSWGGAYLHHRRKLVMEYATSIMLDQQYQDEDHPGPLNGDLRTQHFRDGEWHTLHTQSGFK